MRKPIRSLRSEDGQAVVELALAIPLLLLVLFAIIQFGQAIAYYNDETNIANLAARYAIVAGTPSCNGSTDISAYAQCEAAQESATFGNNVQACVIDSNDSAGTYSGINVGDPLEVYVYFNFKIGAGLPLFNFLPTSLTIASSATMRVEGLWSGAGSYPYVNTVYKSESACLAAQPAKP